MQLDMRYLIESHCRNKFRRNLANYLTVNDSSATFAPTKTDEKREKNRMHGLGKVFALIIFTIVFGISVFVNFWSKQTLFWCALFFFLRSFAPHFDYCIMFHHVIACFVFRISFNSADMRLERWILLFNSSFFFVSQATAFAGQTI